MPALITSQEEALYENAALLVESARAQVARTVNTAMVHANWAIGREIVKIEQGGRERAGYGEGVVNGLSRRLTQRFGKGFSYASVKRIKQFYLTFPNGSAIPTELRQSEGGLSILTPAAPGRAVASKAQHC